MAASVILRRGRHNRLHRVLTLIGVTIIFGSLLAIPVLPFVMNILGPIKSSYTATVPKDADGAFLVTPHGQMELFPWSFPLNDFPGDAPALARSAIHGLMIQQNSLDFWQKYSLYNYDSQQGVPLRLARSTATRYYLLPVHPLRSGRYLLLMPAAGSFGDQVWCYFAVK